MYFINCQGDNRGETLKCCFRTKRRAVHSKSEAIEEEFWCRDQRQQLALLLVLPEHISFLDKICSEMNQIIKVWCHARCIKIGDGSKFDTEAGLHFIHVTACWFTAEFVPSNSVNKTRSIGVTFPESLVSTRPLHFRSNLALPSGSIVPRAFGSA